MRPTKGYYFTSGLAIIHLIHIISLKSKLQPITATSSHEAELIALAYGADEKWILKMLDELWYCYKEMIIAPEAVDTSTSTQRASVINACDDAPALLGSNERFLINASCVQHQQLMRKKRNFEFIKARVRLGTMTISGSHALSHLWFSLASWDCVSM